LDTVKVSKLGLGNQDMWLGLGNQDMWLGLGNQVDDGA